jgi:hypothetical protein
MAMTAVRSPLARSLRGLLALAALANLGLAAGFATQAAWAVQLWPWETGRLSHLFLSAMLAAIGVAAAWIAASGEAGSLPAGFLNLTVTLGGIAGYLLVAAPEHRILGVAVGVVALCNLGLLLLSRRLPAPEVDPLPALVRVSYVVFAVVLLAVGSALILRADGIMPWPLDPHTSVVFGWIFFGDAFYFAYAVARPHWGSARAQLWSFLAYDAVLLVPLAAHLRNVDPDLLPNLVVYLAVLVYSAVLAVYYLIVNPRTRGWRTQPLARHGAS